MVRLQRCAEKRKGIRTVVEPMTSCSRLGLLFVRGIWSSAMRPCVFRISAVARSIISCERLLGLVPARATCISTSPTRAPDAVGKPANCSPPVEAVLPTGYGLGQLDRSCLQALNSGVSCVRGKSAERGGFCLQAPAKIETGRRGGAVFQMTVWDWGIRAWRIEDDEQEYKGGWTRRDRLASACCVQESWRWCTCAV